nr:MAG TPA: CodY-like protein [Caudoviricetes sp.]
MDKLYLNVHDVMALLDVSQSKAYQIIKELNNEMATKGYLTVSGKVNRRYLLERCYSQEVGA